MPLWFDLLNRARVFCLKGLGHAMLGNFSIDQTVIELTANNKITAQNYRRTQIKHRRAKKGQGWKNWRGLKWIAIG